MRKFGIKTSLSFAFMLISLASFSQLDGVGKILSGGVEDGSKIINGYLSPYLNALGADLNAGWYNTAKPHKLGGFDLTFTFNMAFVPETDKTFDLSKLGLIGNIDGNPIAPTAAGENKKGPTMQYEIDNPANPGTTIPLAQYATPGGLGIGIIPAPMAQIGIGLIKGTDIVGRYLPNISLGKSGNLGLWGIGVKHSVKQWIPVIEKIPVLEISVFGGYTKFNSSVGFSLEPGDLNFSGTEILDKTVTSSFDNQNMQLGVSSFTGNLLVGANLPVISFYGGLGFASTKSNLKLNGTYPIPTVITNNSDSDFGRIAVTDDSVANDIDIIKNNKSTNARLNIGMRIKMGVVTLHGDYTKSAYSTVTAGIGISFR